MNTFVVVPAYNESPKIFDVVSELVRSSYSVVVVDDGSSDDTTNEALRGGAIVVQHALNRGQGAALQTGIEFTLGLNPDFICTFDADGQHDAKDINKALDLILSSNSDVVLGSRFLGRAENIPFIRSLVLKLAVQFTRLTSGAKLTDAHNGFRVFRASAIRHLSIKQDGMAHASEIIEEIVRLKLAYIECPVTIRYTEYSHSKGQASLNSINILKDLLKGCFIK